MKRKPLTEAGSPNILAHVVATYDAFHAVLGFLCHHVLRLPEVHTRDDAFAAYNGTVREYKKLWRTTLLGACSYADNFLPRPSIGACA